MQSEEAPNKEKELVEIFVEKRKSLGLSYKQAADRCGTSVDYQTIFRFEKGKLRLTPKVFDELVSGLRVVVPIDLIPEFKAHKGNKTKKTELGQALLKKRVELGFSQPKLAELLKCSPARISQLENGSCKLGKGSKLRVKLKEHFPDLPIED